MKGLLLLLLVLAGCTAPAYRIGVLVPLSGDAAFLGDGIVNALTLAQEDGITYQFIFEDTQLDADKTATATAKLIHADDVDAFISFSSGVSNVVAPLAEEYRIPHIAIASDPMLARGDYTVVHWTPPAAEAELWVAEAQRRGVQRIAVIVLNQQGAIAILDEVKARLGDIRLVHESLFDSGEHDFRTILLKARETDPDLYLVGAFSPELEMLAKQAHELNIAPLSTIEAFEFTSQPELFEGYWYVNAAGPTDKFWERYTIRFGVNPTPGAANAYDAVHLLQASNGNIDALHAIRDFQGALGNLSIDAEGIVWSTPIVRSIVHGQPVNNPDGYG